MNGLSNARPDSRVLIIDYKINMLQYRKNQIRFPPNSIKTCSKATT